MTKPSGRGRKGLPAETFTVNCLYAFQFFSRLFNQKQNVGFMEQFGDEGLVLDTTVAWFTVKFQN